MKQWEAAKRQKRGGGRVRGESVFLRADAIEELEVGIQAIADQEPTPDLAVELSEQVQVMLTRLGDDSLREIAVLKLEGFSNEEIADRLQCGLRTVERKLRGIRAIWGEEETGD
jgi:DNA-directed RNA polymerase specialized sigma24 family protein